MSKNDHQYLPFYSLARLANSTGDITYGTLSGVQVAQTPRISSNGRHVLAILGCYTRSLRRQVLNIGRSNDDLASTALAACRQDPRVVLIHEAR
jgi:hypothetical protein